VGGGDIGGGGPGRTMAVDEEGHAGHASDKGSFVLRAGVGRSVEVEWN
jgi:hypothetical protein